MKLNIKRPSTFIRYTDNELTPEQQAAYSLANRFIQDPDNREEVLEMADPVWYNEKD